MPSVVDSFLALSRDFPGWQTIDERMTESSKYPYPQEYLGVERQRVKPNDLVERRRRYLVRWTSLKAERSRQWDKWRDLADHHIPELGRFLTSDHNKPKDTSKILNNTPTRMARALAAGLLAGHTSPARPWINLTVLDQDLAEWGPMRVALYELNRRVRLIYEISGFYRAMAMGVYPGLATFGLGTCICEEDFKRVLRFVPLAMGTYAIATDGKGEVDTLQYEEAWSVGQLVKEFGWDNVSNSVRVAWNGGWYDQYIAVLRTIESNDEFIPGNIGRSGKRWGSAWMEIGGLASAAGALAQPSSDPVIGFLRDSGYSEFPALCARWATTSRDDYPTGPGHDSLPDARMLMQLERRKLLAISKGINPAMLIPDVLRMNRLSMLPGDAIYYPTGTQNIEIKPAHIIDPRFVTETREESVAAMERIGQAFFYELMMMFSNPGGSEGKQPDTAAEIAAKQQEKMLQLGPVLENINEFLTRLVERTISIMGRRGLMPKFPREAGNARIKIEFVSTLAQAQKLMGTQAKERLLQFVGQVAQLSSARGPTEPAKVVMKINTDKMIDRYADDVGVTPDVMATDEEVAAARQQLDAEANAQKTASALMNAADAAKTLGQVPMDEDNLASRMLGQPAGQMAQGAA
jgi:hypothetical protein